MAFLHTFNRKSVQKLSAVIFELKIFKLVNGDPLPPVASLLIFLRSRYQLQSMGSNLYVFLAFLNAQLKQAREEFKAKLSGGHWNPFQGGRSSPDQRAAEFSATFTEQSLRNFAVKVAK